MAPPFALKNGHRVVLDVAGRPWLLTPADWHYESKWVESQPLDDMFGPVVLLFRPEQPEEER